MTIEGDPGLRINPIYVGDAISVFEPALRLTTSELFNVAGDDLVTITDLVRLMGNVVGKQGVVQHTEVNPSGDLIGDNTRLKKVLEISPQVSLLDGLHNMV